MPQKQFTRGHKKTPGHSSFIWTVISSPINLPHIFHTGTVTAPRVGCVDGFRDMWWCMYHTKQQISGEPVCVCADRNTTIKLSRVGLVQTTGNLNHGSRPSMAYRLTYKLQQSNYPLEGYMARTVYM